MKTHFILPKLLIVFLKKSFTICKVRYFLSQDEGNRLPFLPIGYSYNDERKLNKQGYMRLWHKPEFEVSLFFFPFYKAILFLWVPFKIRNEQKH